MAYYALGLMSGTSLDGLDICYARFSENSGKWKFEILIAETEKYPKSWEDQLRNADKISAEALLELHSQYGFYLGNSVKKFLQKHKIEQTDIIASHGHTVFHQPQKKFTTQIGDGRAIMILTKIPVVYDFRSQDVLLGGNGAPLVPIGDELLFDEFDACLNLGGFSNISFKKSGKRIAFDICPVNSVLNYFARQLGKDYDEDGGFARSGNLNMNIFQELNQLEFYKSNAPKSLGTEWLHKEIFPLLVNDTAQNIMATFTEHAAFQIAKVINENSIKNILITGGGAKNSYLVSLIKKYTTSDVIIPDYILVDYKEALIFALMGVLRKLGKINVLSSATGSIEDHCTGILVE